MGGIGNQPLLPLKDEMQSVEQGIKGACQGGQFLGGRFGIYAFGKVFVGDPRYSRRKCFLGSQGSADNPPGDATKEEYAEGHDELQKTFVGGDAPVTVCQTFTQDNSKGFPERRMLVAKHAHRFPGGAVPVKVLSPRPAARRTQRVWRYSRQLLSQVL